MLLMFISRVWFTVLIGNLQEQKIIFGIKLYDTIRWKFLQARELSKNKYQCTDSCNA